MSFEQLGLDSAWVTEPDPSIQTLVNSLNANEFENARRLINVARQTAKWRYLTWALVDLFCASGDLKQRREIVGRKLEELTDIPQGQGGRYLNSLGLFTNRHAFFEQSQSDPTVAVMKDQLKATNNIGHLEWGSFEQLGIKTGEPLNRFLMEPYQVIANTAYCLLTFRAAKTTQMTQEEHLEFIKQRYPKVPFRGIVDRPSEWNPTETRSATTLFGVYLVCQARQKSSGEFDSKEPLTPDLIQDTIRICARDYPWVFPSSGKPEDVKRILDSSAYQADVAQLLLETGRAVGQAICRVSPFNESSDFDL